MDAARSMRAVKGSLATPLKRSHGSEGRARWPPVLAQRAVADSPRWTRAVGYHLTRPQEKKWEKGGGSIHAVKNCLMKW